MARMYPTLTLYRRHRVIVQGDMNGFFRLGLIGVYPCTTALQVNLRPLQPGDI